jgi:hypothetical protein
MEVLSRSGEVTDLHVVLGTKLEEPLEASAGMLGPLAFIAMRKQ